MKSYDIDGVLAQKPPGNLKKWGLMNGGERQQRKQDLLSWYRSAKPLLKPEEPFVAVSARKSDPVTLEITKAWMEVHHAGLVHAIRLLDTSRTYDNVAKFKARVIAGYRITDHVEDDMTVIKKIHGILGDSVRFHFYEEGMDAPRLLSF